MIKNQNLNVLRSLVKELVLQENISRLLAEAAFTPENMPDELTITAFKKNNSIRLELTKRKQGKKKVVGTFNMQFASDYYVDVKMSCYNAFVVSYVESNVNGMGPLLYDVGIDIASHLGGGLTADRAMVTRDARSVWDFIDKNRSDIQKKQLDNLDNELTPIELDNCFNDSAERDADRNDMNHWSESPLSKVAYRSGLPVVKRLLAAGKIEIDEQLKRELGL
jgi:hypothetical protein